MHEPLKLNLFIKLLLDDDKCLGVYGLKFDFRKILYLQTKRGFVFTQTFDGMRNQQLLGRQWMMSSGADFGQQQVTVCERNRVTIGRNIDAQLVLFAFDCPPGTDIEKLGVYIPREQMKIQICNFRPRG